MCNVGARDPESIGILDIGARMDHFLNSYENRRGASVESRLRAANHSERILQAGRRRAAASQQEERGHGGEQKSLGEVPQGQRRKPASWGISLSEREAKEEKEKTVSTKAEKRANVPEERLEFLRQKEQRKRQRWGDPVSCEGFETHQTKKLKATMLNMTVGDFIELQEWLSLEEKCKLAFLDPDFERSWVARRRKTRWLRAGESEVILRRPMTRYSHGRGRTTSHGTDTRWRGGSNRRDRTFVMRAWIMGALRRLQKRSHC